MKNFQIRSACKAALGVTLALSFSPAVLAAEGYVTDSASSQVVSDYGECVRTGFWSSDMNTPECDPSLAAKLEAERLEAERLAKLSADEAAARAAAIQPAAARLMSVSDSGDVAFAFDSAALTNAAIEELQQVSAKVSGYSKIERIEIIGYTDAVGPEGYNQQLSERRAQSVRKALADAGLPADLMEAKGMGEANPVADNNTREGRAQNRRVDINIVGQRAQ